MEKKEARCMRGIRLAHGVTFVEHEGLTVRISKSGEVDVSPVAFMVLEWDLRTEPPERWEYLSEGDIRALGEEIVARIEALADTLRP
jgi:hypothetical protein